MSDALTLMMGGVAAGRVTRGTAGLRLEYADSYLSRADPTPVSLSMPVSRQRHGDPVVTAWLWGLLPDDPVVLRRWATAFETRSTSPFDLLATPVGEDCAGAVAFVPDSRLDVFHARGGQVEWLDEADVAVRLRGLREDRATWLGTDPGGRFSLAGAQAKTALLVRDGHWGVPSGSTPTTHILKPAIVGLDNHDLNEHLCLSAARRCGMNAARSTVQSFAGEQALVVERYDRAVRSDGMIRIHQEDVCQALGISPERKYQNEGGPSSTDVATLLRDRTSDTDAVLRFTEALIFNWLIGWTDAHAKNYSLLLAGSTTRLAPLYDIASALPYPDMHVRKLRPAMKFAGAYTLTGSGRRTWLKVAEEVGLPVETVHETARALITAVPDALADAAADPAVKQLASDLPATLVDAVAARARECARAL
jgi:serine/threonine-protein kinase HipA